MRRIYRMLPGPTPVRVLLSVVLIVVGLIGLFFFYDWVGSNFLDSGGSIG